MAQQIYGSYTLEQHVELELLEILDDANAPDYLYRKVMEWAKKAKTDGYSFEPRIMNRRPKIDEICQILTLNHLKPKVETVKQYHAPLDKNGEVIEVEKDIVVFDFFHQVCDLLSDPKLMDPKNLNIEEDDFQKVFENKSGLIGGCLTGKWYERTAIKMKIKGEDFLVPIKIFSDKTHINLGNACSVEGIGI